MEKLDNLVARQLKERLLDPDRREVVWSGVLGGYRRDHLRTLPKRLEVDKGEVRIMGSKSDLLTLLVANGVGTAAGGVPAIEPKWRATPDDDEHYT